MQPACRADPVVPTALAVCSIALPIAVIAAHGSYSRRCETHATPFIILVDAARIAMCRLPLIIVPHVVALSNTNATQQLADALMEAKDERFYTPRSSAQRGVSSTGSEDERFVSPRESARSVSSDDNEYATPRESASSTADMVSHSTAAIGKLRLAESKRDDFGKLEHKSQDKYSSPSSGRYAPPETVRGAQLVAPPAPDNDIFSAARHNRIDSVTYMLDQGMSVNSRDEQGNTILLIACQNGLKRMAKLALRRGADIDAQNFRGNTALHFCFAYGYGDSLGEYLISKGADSSITNRDGGTCFDGLGTPLSARK